MTSFDDDHVPSWIPLKWTAKWRHLEYQNKQNHSQQRHRLVLCRTYDKGGHFGTFGQNPEKKVSYLGASHL